MTTRAASPQAFTTYGNYLRAWRYLFQQMGATPVAFGPGPANPPGITPQRAAQVEACLQRYWGNLRALDILNSSGIAAEVLTVHPPIAYYAVHNALRAYLFSRNIQASETHRGVLNRMAQVCQHTQLPPPWSAYCEGAPRDRIIHGLGQFAWPASNLETVNAWNATGFVAWSLSSARRDEVRVKVEEERGNRQRAAPGTQARHEQSLAATTIFDVFYRYRREAHYGKTDNFAAFETEDEGNRFGADLFEVVDATTWMLEKEILQRAGTARMRGWYNSYMNQHQIVAGEGPVGRRFASLP